MCFYLVIQIGEGKEEREKGREEGKEKGEKREGGKEEGGREKLFQIAFQIQTILSAIIFLFGEYKFDLLKQPKDI